MDNSVYTGILETDQHRAYLRAGSPALGIRPSDPVVDARLIREYQLRQGALVTADVSKANHKARVEKLVNICGLDPHQWLDCADFNEGTVIDPQPQLHLEPFKRRDAVRIPYGSTSMRVVDLVCPLGRGQRALIVAPPRVGKTVLLQQIANALGANYPDLKIIMLLIDERPEEVTDMRRNVPGEVFASCNDRPVRSHLRLAKLVIDYAKCLTVAGQHVVVLLDSLTRVGRAFNVGRRGSGRIMSGGIDARALEIP